MSSEELEFDQALTQLIKELENVIRTKNKIALMVGKVVPALNYLKKYQRLYQKSEPREHFILFEELYQKHRKKILNGPQRDRWLRDNEVVVRIGDKGKDRQYALMISLIYRDACQLKKDLEKVIEDSPEKPIDQDDELYYPNRILLQLYRIWSVIAPEKDRSILRGFVDEIKKELGEEEKAKEENKTIDPSNPLNFLNKALELNNGNFDLGSAINKIMNNQTFQKMVGEMYQTFNETGVNGLVEKVQNDLSNPELNNVIKDLSESIIKNQEVEQKMADILTLPGKEKGDVEDHHSDMNNEKTEGGEVQDDDSTN